MQLQVGNKISLYISKVSKSFFLLNQAPLFILIRLSLYFYPFIRPEKILQSQEGKLVNEMSKSFLFYAGPIDYTYIPRKSSGTYPLHTKEAFQKSRIFSFVYD